MLSFKKLIFLSFVIAVVVFIGQNIIYRKDYRISTLLKDVVQFLDRLDTTLIKAEKLTHEDPYKELIEEIKVQYEKLASIKKQTEIYDKMERMEGGPMNFITTSLSNLDAIAQKTHEHGTQYRQIVQNTKKSINSLQEDYKASLEGLDTVFDSRCLDELERVRIFLSEPEELFDDNENDDVELETIKDKMTNLAEQFAQLEDLQQEQDIERNNKPSDEKESQKTKDEIDLGNKITTLIKEVAETISRDEQIYRSVMPKIGLKWRILEEAVSKIGDHQTHIKTRYETLDAQLNTDIIRTRERINALKLPKKIEL